MSPRKRVQAVFPQAYVICGTYNIFRVVLWPGGDYIAKARKRSIAWDQARQIIEEGFAEARAKGLA